MRPLCRRCVAKREREREVKVEIGMVDCGATGGSVGKHSGIRAGASLGFRSERRDVVGIAQKSSWLVLGGASVNISCECLERKFEAVAIIGSKQFSLDSLERHRIVWVNKMSKFQCK